MWICRNCDTRNDDLSQYCACCGEKRQDRVAPDPRPGTDSDNSLTEQQYQVAKSFMQHAKTEAEYQQAIQRLAILNSYKDAEDLIKLCNERINELKAENGRDSGDRAHDKESKKEKKSLKYAAAVCYFLAGIIISFCVLNYDRFVTTTRVKLDFMKPLYRVFMYDTNFVRYQSSVMGSYGGIICCILLILAFLLVIAGLLGGKRRPVIIGSVISMVACFALPAQLFYGLEYRILLGKQGGMAPDFRWIRFPVLTLFYLSLILYFAALLLCSARKKQSRFFGWAGCMLALAKLIPSGYMTWLVVNGGLKNKMHFGLSIWAVVLSLLLAIGSVCAGYIFSSSE